MADLDPANLHKLRVVDLKEILVKKGLSTSGLKAELVKRLRDAILNKGEDTQTEGQSHDPDATGDIYDNPSQSDDAEMKEKTWSPSAAQESPEQPMDVDDPQADSNQQGLEDAAGRKMAEEHQRRMAEERQKRLADADEQERLVAEEQRRIEEKRREEQIRIEEERQKEQQIRIEEERQKEEQRRVEEERQKEQKRIEEERLKQERKRVEEERQKEERRRMEEERQKVDQRRRMEEEMQKEERRRMEEERKRVEQRRMEDERKRLEQRRMEEERQQEEQKRMDEQRRKEEQRRRMEEERQQEQKRLEEERQREEQRRRMEEERRREEQRRRIEEERQKEQKRLEEERRTREQRLHAEEEKRKEERRLYLEEERRKEEQRLYAEEERRKEEQKKQEAEKQRLREEEMRKQAEIAKQQLAHQQKLLAEKEKIRLAEEQQRLLAEEQKRLMAEEQQRLLTEQQRLMAEEQQRLLVEEQQRILAEQQQKRLAEQQQKRLAEQQQKLIIEQQQKFLGEQQQKMLAHQLTPPGLLPTSMPPPPPLQQFTQPPPAPPASIVTTAISNAFPPPPPPPALNSQTSSKEPDVPEKQTDNSEMQISDKDPISDQSEEIKLPHAVEKILALKNERAQQLGIDPDSVIDTAVELKESTVKKTVPRGLVSIDENEDEELEEEETSTKVKESRRRRKKKKKQKRSSRVTRPSDNAKKTETVKQKNADIDIEYVQDVLDPSDPLYSQFVKIFEKFKLGDGDKDKADADASMEEMKQEPKLIDKKKPMDLDDDDDDDDDDEDDKKEEDKPKLSKRKLKKLSRMTVAELKQKVSRPELVEMHDVTAKDPVLLLHLKASRNTVPVPRHWCFKRKYLQGKRGIEKPAFELPDFIKRTGIMEMRQALQEKEDQKTMKAKMRERVRPKLGKIDIDYQKLHDAFFKWQTKPKMTIHGDLYYEGKEFETRLKEKKPGDLNDDLRIALGMPTGPNANKCPPPWLIAMQRYGPPPSYPNLKIPGLNAPIPDSCSFGYHAGGWGKPPVDEQGRPLYGDVFGTLNADDLPHIAEEEIDHTKWGELESESSEEEEEEDEDEDEEEEEPKGEDETGLVTPAEGLITPSGFSSIPAGMETPDMIELRKRKIEAEMEGGETPALYTILPEKKSERVGASMMGSTHIYDLAAAIPAAKIKVPGTTSVPPQGIEVALDPSELEMDTAAMAARYEQTMREQQSQLKKEDLSDMVAEYSARQKTKRKRLQEDSGKASKKYKFKF